jgi:uncharacterized membrane protein YhaH (DUF805 family)
MGFMDAVRSCLSKYVDFKGRASRSEYWYFALFFALLFGSVFLAVRIAGTTGMVFGFLAVVMLLGLLLPTIAVSVRRLHDTNSSGWWYLIVLIPYIGGPILFVWFCFKGTVGDNRFGPDPLQGDVAEAFT